MTIAFSVTTTLRESRNFEKRDAIEC
jgi:hypothetical protein